MIYNQSHKTWGFPLKGQGAQRPFLPPPPHPDTNGHRSPWTRPHVGLPQLKEGQELYKAGKPPGEA